MKKKLLSILLCLCMVASLLPTAALATSWSGVSAGGIGFNYTGATGSQFIDITMPTTDGYYTYGTCTTAEGITTATETKTNQEILPGSGWNWAVKYHTTAVNGANYTLTLKDFNLNYTGTDDGLMFRPSINLVLVGTNIINAPQGGTALSAGTDKALYISGTGSLTATGRTRGISVSQYGSITISGNTVIAASGAEAGIYGNCTITGGTVTAKGGCAFRHTPVLTSYQDEYIATASTDYDGQSPVSYAEEYCQNYKYVCIKSINVMSVDFDGTGGNEPTLYTDFAEGWNAAVGNGNTKYTTVKLLDNWTATAGSFGTGDGFGGGGGSTSGNIFIPAGKTITLDLNGRAIDRGLTELTEYGNVIRLKGTLTLNDSGGESSVGEGDGTTGKITGGHDTAGGGVGIFSGTFTMNGGKITGNQATRALNDEGESAFGGGVYIFDSASTFTMNGGEISGNTVSGVDSVNGGGVYVNGTFMVGGTAKIFGNHKGTDANAADYDNNVYLPQDMKIICAVDPQLTTDASIGVTTASAPTNEAPVNITNGEAGDYSACFHSDNASYTMQNGSEDRAQVVQLIHIHSDWVYSVGDSANVLKATCGASCTSTPAYSESVTITAPTLNTYGGTGSASATLTYSNGGTTVGGETPTIKYYIGTYATKTSETETAPTNAGSYVATVTVGTDKTAYVEYTIAKADSAVTTAPTAKSDLVYTVGTPLELVNAGSATGGELQYSLTNTDGNWSTSIPTATDAGSYTVYYKVVGGSNYNDVAAAGPINVTIAKQPVSAPTIASKAYTGETLTADVDTTNKPYTVTTNAGGTAVASTYPVVLTLTAPDNYEWSDDSVNADKTLSFAITKGTWSATSATGSAKYGNSGTVDLSAKLAPGGTFGDVNVTEGSKYFNGTPSLTGNTLNFAFQNDHTYANQQATITIPVTGATNYENYNITVSLTISDKPTQEAFAFVSAPTTKTYGDASYSVTTTGNVGGTVSYNSTNPSVATVDATSGEVTILTAGTTKIQATVTETDDYAATTISHTLTVAKKSITAPTADSTPFTYNGQAQTYTLATGAGYTITDNTTQTNANTYTVTATLTDTANTKWSDSDSATKDYEFVIAKATITITAKDKSAYVGDTAPVLGTVLGTDYTVTGLASGETLATAPTLAYASTPVMTAAGTATIVPSGAAAPAGDNYNAAISYNNGTLTISNRPSSGDSYTPSLVTEIKQGGSTTADNLSRLISGKKDLTVTGADGAKLVFDTAALKGIDAKTTGSVTVKIEDVSKAHQDTHEGKMVFSLTVVSGGKTVTDFGGSVTVSLPYTLKDGEKAEDVSVWYLASDGTMTELPCTYDAKTGLATFTVTHFSEYVVGVSEWVNPFSDVKEADWFYDDAAFVAAKSLMSGTSATTFAPHANTSRGMIVTILYRLEGQPTVTGANPFDDVQSGKYYESAIIWAAQNGIVSGYGNGKFGPDDDITREQMAAILYNYAKYKGYDVTASADLSKFTDSGKLSGYAVTALSWANANGLVTGKGNGILDPQGNAERCQVAAILHRFCENVVK